MKLKYIKILICLFVMAVYTFSNRCYADDSLIINNSGAYIKDFNVNQLQNLYDFLEFPNYLNMEDNVYPRVFVKNIPHDYAKIEDKTYRNQMFINILIPLILKVNKEYEEERDNLLAIQYGFFKDKDFHEFDRYYIEKLAEKYEVAVPYKDTRKYIRLLEELLLRVDIIPPSILLATAAIYTDWGTSRIAVEANNLYKAKNWYSNEGLEPLSDDKDYKYTMYDSLEDSIRDYILKVNRSVNYRSFWDARKTSREVQDLVIYDTLYGKRVDWAFVLENNLKNYAGLLDYTITYYRMQFLDGAQLDDEYEFDN